MESFFFFSSVLPDCSVSVSPGGFDADNLSAQLQSVCFLTDIFGWLVMADSLSCLCGTAVWGRSGQTFVRAYTVCFTALLKLRYVLNVFIAKFVKVTKVDGLCHSVCVCSIVRRHGPSRSEELCFTRGNGRITKRQGLHMELYLSCRDSWTDTMSLRNHGAIANPSH